MPKKSGASHSDQQTDEMFLPSAPYAADFDEDGGVSHLKPPRIQTEEIVRIPPIAVSFDQLEKSEWMLPPTTLNNFIEWSDENGVREENKNWLRTSNANTDEELLKAANTRPHPGGFWRSIKVALHAITTGILSFGIWPLSSTRNIKPGEIHFSDNAGISEIHTGAGLHYLSGFRHSWSKMANAIHDYITGGNITIARILPKKIAVAMDNGQPVVLLPGRHAYNSPLFKLEQNKIYDLDRPDISVSSLSIIRVKPGQLGLAKMNGNPVLLMPGVHIRNDIAFEFCDFLDTRSLRPRSQLHQAPQECFEHSNVSVIKIEKGKIGCAIKDNEPVFLEPGIHVQNSQGFQFVGSVDANSPHIAFSTIHHIRVESNQLGLAWDGNNPVILTPGTYDINSPSFRFVEFKNTNDPLIEHGSHTIVKINQGERGYAWHAGDALELKPGLHHFNDPQLKYAKSFKSNEPVIQFGGITHVIVNEGERRAIWRDGNLEVLEPGCHDFKSTRLELGEKPIYMQDTIIPLHEIHVTTRDRIPMHITGQVTYRITDPRQMILGIGQDKWKRDPVNPHQNDKPDRLKKALDDSTTVSLRHHISLTDLSMISPDHHHGKGPQDPSGTRIYPKDTPSYAMDPPDILEQKQEGRAYPQLIGDLTESENDAWRGALCNQVQEELRAKSKKWGIEILNVAISDIAFQDPEVTNNLAAASIATRKAEAAYDLQVAQNATNLSRITSEAEQQKITNEMNADKVTAEKKARADAEYYAKTRDADAQAEVQRIQAKAQMDVAATEGNALKIRATARMEASTDEAKGETALFQSKLVLLQDENYVRLENKKYDVEIAKYLSNSQTPAVVIQGGGASDAMFLGQGNGLLDFGVRQQSLKNCSATLFRPKESQAGSLSYTEEYKTEKSI